MKERIIDKLKENLTVESLNVINESYLHKGHLGDNGSNETHFKIEIKAKELEGERLVNSHRKIKELLKDEFRKNGLHALSIKVLR